ncbi:MAG: helix-turn-helix domain-containing protein [Oscillospiraceae bacterium]|nr:helix-turn-helix domain-containing protein [Oscillospiraceae bacterium]
MYLPGTINERIGDLRTSKGLSQKELSDLIGISASQMSRIESGETKSISSEILVALAKIFGVSTDYILGLTTVSVPKSYDISELGLSEGAVKALLMKTVDSQALSLLVEHKHFPELLRLIEAYFSDNISTGIKARNEIINMATATLGDFVKTNPEYKPEAQADVRLLRSQKLGEHEAEIEKIKNVFLSILKDVKKSVDSSPSPATVATAEIMQQTRAQLQSAVKNQKKFEPEDIAEIVTNMVGQQIPLDDASKELFVQLVKKVFENQR